MRQVAAILGKDVRVLGPQLAAALAITALLGWLDSDTSSSGPLTGAAALVWALAWIYVTVALIQQERLPGDRQYWLARPYDWRCLLSAKALFLVGFAVMPLALARGLALAVNGVSPLGHAAGAAGGAIYLAGAVALSGAVLAAITGSLLQFLWAFLAVAAVSAFSGSEAGSWGTTGWLHCLTGGALLQAAAAPLLLLQYSRRATSLSRIIVAGVVLAEAAAVSPAVRPGARPSQHKLASARALAPALAISFDPAARPPIGYADAPYFPGLAQEGFYLPIRVSGIPKGGALVSEGAAVTIDDGAARRWSSGWTREDTIAGVNALEDRRFVRNDGIAWQYVNVDREFYRGLGDTPVRIHVAATLVLLGGRERAAIRGDGRTRGLPMEGICNVRRAAIPLPPHVRGIAGVRTLGVFCAWPLPGPERAYLRAASSGAVEATEALLADGARGAASAGESVWQHGAAVVPVRDARPGLTVETWRAETGLEISYELAGVRLSGYTAPRVTSPQ